MKIYLFYEIFPELHCSCDEVIKTVSVGFVGGHQCLHPGKFNSNNIILINNCKSWCRFTNLHSQLPIGPQ